MTTDIKITRPESSKLVEIERWLLDNVGLGSHRTIKNGFMGMDDWFYYDDVPEDDDEYLEIEDDIEDYQEYLVFTFRREADATVFALKWTTQTV
jgi:hypothetical protein